MGMSKLPPELDLLTREFYIRVAQDPSFFPDTPVTQRNLLAACLELLNYNVIDGKYVTPGKSYQRSLFSGECDGVVCEWKKDTLESERVLREEGYGEDGDQGSDEADSSESAESAPLWQTVLRKDV